MFRTKESVAKLSIAAISLLIIIKAIASVVTGSISIRADAIHSAIDLTGVIVGYIGIRISGKPADEDHSFGHGKAEHIASGIIAGFIFVAAGTICFQAIQRLFSGEAVQMVTVGIYVTMAAIAVNLIVSWYAMKVARDTDSAALEATASDLFADVLSSVAVLVGLVLVKLTGLNILDPIVALLVTVIIARTAYLTLRKSFKSLMDTELPEEEVNEIMLCIREHTTEVVSFHDVRTRKAGNLRFIDLHLVMPRDISVEDAHYMCDHLEEDIKNRFPRCSVTIHVEPCTEECRACLVLTCTLRRGIV